MKRLNDTQQGSGLALIGFALTCLYALTKIHAPDALSNSIGLPMVLLGFFAIYRYGKGLSVRVPMLLFLASIFIPLISWYFAHLAHPTWVDPSPKLDKLARIFIFLPIAWWLKDSQKKVFILWGLASLTVLASPWVGGGGWQEIVRGWHGGRIDYNLRNAGHTSLFFGLILIGLICFSSRLYHWKKASLFLWIPCALFCLFTMIAAQTRAAWLALIASLVISLCYFLLSRRSQSKIDKKKVVILATIILLITTVAYKTMGRVIENRSTSESSVIEQILSGNLKDIPYTSVGIRIHLWEAALTKIKERPLLGWSNRGQSIAIDKNNWMPDYIKLDFGHLHNSYLSILTDYGFVGLAFYFFWFGWMLIKILRAVSKGFLRQDVGYFTVATLAFWSIANLFESYLFFWTGVFCLQIIFGGLLGLIWHAQIQENKQNAETSSPHPLK